MRVENDSGQKTSQVGPLRKSKIGGRWLLMGTGRMIFRVAVCVAIILVLMLLTAPKAC